LWRRRSVLDLQRALDLWSDRVMLKLCGQGGQWSTTVRPHLLRSCGYFAECGKLSRGNLRKIKYGTFHKLPIIAFPHSAAELLDFIMHGETNRGRHTDHPAGHHSIWTNQCPPAPSRHILLQARCPSCCPTNSVKALKATSAFGLRRRR